MYQALEVALVMNPSHQANPQPQLSNEPGSRRPGQGRAPLGTPGLRAGGPRWKPSVIHRTVSPRFLPWIPATHHLRMLPHLEREPLKRKLS